MTADLSYRDRALRAEARVAELEDELAAWRANAREDMETEAALARRVQVQFWLRAFLPRAGTAMCAAILLEFLDAPGKTLRRPYLAEVSRVPGAIQDEINLKSIDVQLVFLRKALAQAGVRLETIWGVGWRLAPDTAAELKRQIFGGAVA